MRQAHTLLIVLTLASASSACHRGDTDTTNETPPPSATCTVPGVEGARRLESITLPSGCRFNGASPDGAPRALHTLEELSAAVVCDGTQTLSVDLATNDVYVASYSMSPAHAGRETLDDGTTVTFVTRFRQNCPDDPMPMPMNQTYGFLIPKGTTRAFREASCTLPRDCN